MAESGGLENRCRGNPPTVGSNPTPSVTSDAVAEKEFAGRGHLVHGALVESSRAQTTCLWNRDATLANMPRADAYRAEVEEAEAELVRRTPRENLRVARTLRTLKSGLAEREQRVLDEAAADFERRACDAQTSELGVELSS